MYLILLVKLCLCFLHHGNHRAPYRLQSRRKPTNSACMLLQWGRSIVWLLFEFPLCTAAERFHQTNQVSLAWKHKTLENASRKMPEYYSSFSSPQLIGLIALLSRSTMLLTFWWKAEALDLFQVILPIWLKMLLWVCVTAKCSDAL